MTDDKIAAMSRLGDFVRRAAGRPGQEGFPGADADGRNGRFESRLVWILGSPRSGSTWLLDLLVHPMVPLSGWNESDLGLERRPSAQGTAPEVIPINEPYVPQHLTPPLFQDQAVSGDFIAVTMNSFRHGQPDYFFADQYADVWRPRLRELVLARLAAQAHRVANAYSLSDPLVVVKEPNGSLGADFLMSLLPKARLLFLLRDGRDVVDSMIDAQKPGGWLERSWDTTPDTEERRLELVRRESVLWVARTAAVQRAYEAHPPELRRRVRYEELRRDPAGGLAELDEWLDLRRGPAGRAEAIASNDFDAAPDEVKGSGRELRAAQPGLWRQNRTPAEQRIMEEVMGEKLREVGYAA